MTTTTQKKVTKPGTTLMRVGLAMVILGIILTLLTGVAAPGQALLILAGIILVIVGYARRVLAAIERR